ncbi:MAG: DUF4388 domain-containing protein [Planctomycetota bacterium]|jgi:chaperonin cofactor prefoldin
MTRNGKKHRAVPRTGEQPGAKSGSIVLPEATDGSVRRLRDENEGLRLRLQAAEEVLEDLGGRSQQASEVVLQNQRLRDQLDSLAAAKRHLEKKLAVCEGAANGLRRRAAGREVAKLGTGAAATDGKGHETADVTGPRGLSVASASRLLPKTWPLSPTGLSGTFAEVPVSQVVQVLEATRKTGCLAVQSGRTSGKTTGAIWFREGQVVGCEFAAPGGKLVDQEAFYAVVALAEGSYEFVSEAITIEPRIRAPVQGLLMEAARRLDERARG